MMERSPGAARIRSASLAREERTPGLFEAPVAEVLPLAVGGSHGAPVVRSSGNEASRSREAGVTRNGPSWIRTRDQSVMSRQL